MSANHDAIRNEEIGDCCAFAQELGVRRHMHLVTTEPAREPLSEQDVKQRKTWKDQVGEDGQDSDEEDEVDTILIHDHEHDRIERERLKKIKGQEPIKAPKLKPRTLPSR